MLTDVATPSSSTTTARAAAALCVVAIGAALFAIAFRASLGWFYRTAFSTTDIVRAVRGFPWWMRVLIPAVGGLLAGLASTSTRARQQSVSNVMEAVVFGRFRLSLRATASRLAGSWAAIASGFSIGREGPLIEFGGTLGARLSDAFGTSRKQARALVAAGTAAGFCAAYNTPFAAILFVIETIVGIVALDAVLPAIAATVVAAALTRTLVGGGPIYGEHAFALKSSVEWFAYGALGAAAAIVGLAVTRGLALAEAGIRWLNVPQPWRAALGGAAVGAIACAVPDVAGNGYEPLNRILTDGMLPAAIAALLVAKILATSVSVASGVPGGMFTPVLLVGGAFGALWHGLLLAVGMTQVGGLGGYALVGMAAASAATIHAPLTAAVMAFELSGDYPIVLPLLLATTVATYVSRASGAVSVYQSELRRRGTDWALTLDGRQVKGRSAGLKE